MVIGVEVDIFAVVGLEGVKDRDGLDALVQLAVDPLGCFVFVTGADTVEHRLIQHDPGADGRQQAVEIRAAVQVLG